MCGPVVARVFDPLNIAGGTDKPLFDIRGLFGSSSTTAPPPQQFPTLPEPEVIKKEAVENARRAQALRSRTVLTSGVGLIDDPAVQKKKTLLGG